MALLPLHLVVNWPVFTTDDCKIKRGCCAGYVLVLLNAVNIISAFIKCYPMNGQEYCFYMNGSILSWDKAKEFCAKRNSTLPIITDEDIDNAFQRFILDSNNVEVSAAADTVWLGAHASHVDDSDQWHWINGQPSG